MLTNLKAFRLSKGLTQDEMAEKLDMSRLWYGLIENGRLAPTDKVKAKLEELFDQPAEKLLESVELNFLTEKPVLF